MYYLLSFKLLRRKSNTQHLVQRKSRMDTEFVGFSEFLKGLPDDKKLSVRSATVQQRIFGVYRS